MHWVEIVGWIAAALTLTAYGMRTMLPLRIMAISANVFFMTYGFLTEIYPTFVLHLILLPFNGYRLWEILKTKQSLAEIRGGGDPLEKLEPLLSTTSHPAGSYIFQKGDAVDSLFLIRNGRVLLEEIDVELSAGDILGEIAFFTEERQRTLSARCVDQCDIALIDEAAFLRLYYQEPSFGLYVMKLATRRLLDGLKRSPEAYLPAEGGRGSEASP